MARVTVEDCVLKVPNRFDLVMLAAQRAREISSGIPLAVDRDNDKNPVVALREIAETALDLDGLSDSLVQGLRKLPEKDEPEEEGGFGSGDTDLLSEMMQSAAAADEDEDAEDEELDVEGEPGAEGEAEGDAPAKEE